MNYSVSNKAHIKIQMCNSFELCTSPKACDQNVSSKHLGKPVDYHHWRVILDRIHHLFYFVLVWKQTLTLLPDLELAIFLPKVPGEEKKKKNTKTIFSASGFGSSELEVHVRKTFLFLNLSFTECFSPHLVYHLGDFCSHWAGWGITAWG